MIKQKFKCYDGKLLQAYLFEPEKKKGIVQLIHGMQEYCGPYFDFAEMLAKKGYVVYMVDLRSHGKSCEKLSNIGKIDGNLFNQCVCDQLCISHFLKHQYNLPLYVLAHSYGSFIAQAMLTKNKNADQFILLGTGYMNRPVIHLAHFLSKITLIFKGKDFVVSKTDKKLINHYNKKYTEGNFVTSDIQQSEKLKKDVLNRVPFSVGFFENMFKSITKLYKRKALKQINKETPIGIFCGQDDPIGNYGKSAIKLFKVYKKYKLNAKLTLYPKMRHSLIHEKKREQVYADLINFLEK